MTRKPNKRGAKPASSKPIPSKVELDGEEGFGEEHDDAANDDAVIGAALKWSGIALAAIVVSAGVVGYIWTRPETVVMKPETPVNEARPRQAPPVEIPKVHFTDVTQSAGISFVHENGATGNKLLPETMGGGCAFFDFDSDGDQDILQWLGTVADSALVPQVRILGGTGADSIKLLGGDSPCAHYPERFLRAIRLAAQLSKADLPPSKRCRGVRNARPACRDSRPIP